MKNKLINTGVSVSSKILSGMADAFASMACFAICYEAKVPEELIK